MKEIIAWIKIILPPLLLIPLVFVPFDMFTAFLWVIGFVVFVKSTVTLTKSIYRNVRKKEPFRKELIRPSLSIIIIVLNLTLISASQMSADNFARRTAKITLEQCNKAGECPACIDGMAVAENGLCRTSYGDYGVKYTVVYKASEDKRSFEIAVRHDIDSFLVIKGGAGVKNGIAEKLELY